MNPYPPRPGAPFPYPPYGHPPFNQHPGMPPYGMPNMQMHPGGMPGTMPMGMPGMPMGMPMHMPMPFPPFMPGPSGYQPGVLPTPGPKVIQGAPVLHSAPTAQASSEPPMTTIARQQQIYNSHNGGTAGNSTLSITLLSSTDETVSIADKVAIACNLLNSHIFTNLSAGLPLTLYIGNVPPELEDAKLTKVLECFGRVTKWNRPVDPVNLIPRGFGFVTYLQGICGYRCFQVLHNFLYDAEEGLAFQVKLGTKEKSAVSQIEQSQMEAMKLLPEDCTISIENIYDFMRDNVTKVLNPPPPVVVPTTAPAVSAVEPSTTTSIVTKPEPPKNLADDGGYNELLEDEDGVGEKLQSEIEKFRLRQKQRDLELEEQRRVKIKSKIKQLNEAKLQSEKNPPAPPLPPNEVPNAGDGSSGGRTAEDPSSGRKRASSGKSTDNQDDIDAKRRRKLEVLQMLSDDAEISALAAESVASSSAPAQTAAPSAPAPLKLLSFATAGGAASKTMKRNIGEEDEEESKPKRKFIPLDFGDDAAGQGVSTIDPMLQRQLQQIEDDDDDEDLDDKDGGAFKKNMNKKKNMQQMSAAAASMIPDNVQAKVLAQAQAISAALASGKLTSSAPVDQAVAAPVLDKKEQLKKLVDNIPTNREELFSYSIDWAAVDANDIVQTVMRPWIVKKIIEYLGEEEESLTNFMVTNLQNHCQPQDLLEELSMVLDEDSEQFVLKLWRMLIYQSLRVAMK